MISGVFCMMPYMLYKNIYIDGMQVLIPGVYLTLVNWTELSVSDQSQDIAGTHARIVSPTYARVRTVTIEGLIDRRKNDLEAVEHLQHIFRLQRHIEAVDTREITVEDEYARHWTLKVKIKEPLEILDAEPEWRGEYYRFRVTLESVGSPIWKSREMIRSPAVGYGREGLYGGVRLGTKLGKKWNQCIASVSLHISWTDTPVRLTIEAVGTVNAPLIVRNVATGAVFRLNTHMNADDVVVIDSEKFKVFKNGNDITTERLPWSPFPTAYGRTDLVVEDIDGRLLSDDVRVYAEYYNTFLIW